MTLTPTQARHLELRIGVSRRAEPPDPDGMVPIPETLVLRRWRALTSAGRDGSTYHGCRLPPSLWRLVRAMLAHEPQLATATVEHTNDVMMQVRENAKARADYLGSVPPDTLRVMLRFLSRGRRLARILDAHAVDSRYGVTDLFLYRVREGRAIDFRFIEVKRHDETVRDDQVAELEMLRGLRLTAGIVRFQKPRRDAAPTARHR